MCQFWLNSFFIAQRTKTAEEDLGNIFGEDGSYIVKLSKTELDKINKDKKDKIAPKDFEVGCGFNLFCNMSDSLFLVVYI